VLDAKLHMDPCDDRYVTQGCPGGAQFLTGGRQRPGGRPRPGPYAALAVVPQDGKQVLQPPAAMVKSG